MDEAREKWVHEDMLLDHRLTWLGITQSLLFTALGFALHESAALPANAPARVTRVLDLLVVGLPYLGLLTSLLIFVGTVGAMIAMVRIKKRFGLASYGVSLLTTALGWTCAVGIAVVFVLAWLAVICVA